MLDEGEEMKRIGYMLLDYDDCGPECIVVLGPDADLRQAVAKYCDAQHDGFYGGTPFFEKGVVLANLEAAIALPDEDRQNIPLSLCAGTWGRITLVEMWA